MCTDEKMLCRECGEPFDEDELKSGLCDDCLTDKAIYGRAINFSKVATPTAVKINPLVAFMFTADEINEILMDKLNEICFNPYGGGVLRMEASKFCLQDKSAFAEYLEEFEG